MARKPAKPRKCRCCGKQFVPRNSLQVVCSPKCAVTHLREQAEKIDARERKQRLRAIRAENRAAKEKLRRRSDWVKRAQAAFNRFVRLRDADQPCVSCDRTNDAVQGTEGWKAGGAWDCGHWLSVGAYPNLRFEPDNAHKQCKSCNGGSHYYAGKNRSVSSAYELNIERRIGAARMAELKADQTPRKYTIDDLREIERQYKQKARELERGRSTPSSVETMP